MIEPYFWRTNQRYSEFFRQIRSILDYLEYFTEILFAHEFRYDDEETEHFLVFIGITHAAFAT
jgi:hypothetical protein